MSENTGSAAKTTEEIKEKNRARNKRKAARGKSIQASERSLNMAELRELAELVDEHGFTDFEFENSNIRVRLSKNPAPQVFQTVQPQVSAAAAAVPQPAAQAQPAAETDAGSSAETFADADADLHKIISPIVGTFYRSPSPDKEPYIKEGSSVSPETVVCIVEAMKLMNEIQAEVSGEVVKIYVENGQPVEYGQPLFGVRK